MLKYQMIPGLTVENPALPVITPRPEDVMANIPGWVALLDPDFVAADLKSARNRALPKAHATPLSSDLATRAWDASTKAFGYSVTSSSPATWCPGDIDPNAWSFFLPFKGGSGTNLYRPLGHATTTRPELPAVVAGDICPNLCLRPSTNEFFVTEYYLSASPAPVNRLVTTINFAVANLVMVTFSTTHGLRLFCNGKQVAAAPNDRRPLTKRFASGEWGTMWGMGGTSIGMHGLLNLDLGAPENAAHRRVIEDFIMSRYGIARAV